MPEAEKIKHPEISIHAPRGGSDCPGLCQYLRNPGDFYPRSPWGGATDTVLEAKDNGNGISIHAPRGGSDLCCLLNTWMVSHFYPRSPWGERRGKRCRINIPRRFLSTLPVGGATGGYNILFQFNGFLSTLPVGGATVRKVDILPIKEDFYPRSPWGERQHCVMCYNGYR